MEDFQLKTLFGADLSGLTAGIQAALSQLNNFVGQAATAGQQAGQKISDGFRNGNQSLQDNFKQVDDLTGGYKRLGDAISSAGSTLTTYVTLPILGVGAAAIKTAGDMQALEKGFAATYKGSEDLGTALDKVKEVAKLPGLGLKEAIAGVTALQATGKFSADQAIKSLSAFGNALATVGKGKAELDRVNLALTQISNTPFLKGGDLNQLRSALPQITDLMQKAFGTTTAEGLKKLGISSQEFIAKITDEADKLPKVTGGINNAFENLGDNGTKALAKVGNALNKAFDVEGIFDKIGNAIEGLADKFAGLDPSTQKLIFGLAGAAAITGPLLVAFGGVVAILPALEAGFATLGVTSLAALAPILPIAAAVAGAAVLIYKNWDELVAYFASSGVKDLFANLADSAKTAAAAIGEAFSTISANADNSLGGLIGAVNPVKLLFEELTVGITSFLNVISGVIKGITSLLTGDFTQALAGAKQAAFGLIDPIANLFGFTAKRTDSALYVLSSQAKEFNAAFPQLAANIKLLNSVKAGPLTTTATPDAPKNAVVDPEAEKRLKALLKAFEDAQKKLSGIDFRVKVGTLNELDGMTEKVKVLTDAIKKLSELPGGSGSAYMTKLLSQLHDASTAVDKLLGNTKLDIKASLYLDLENNAVATVQKQLDKADLEAKVKLDLDGDQAAFKDQLAKNYQDAVAGLAKANVSPTNTNALAILSQGPQRNTDAFDAKSVEQYTAALKELSAQQQVLGTTFNASQAQLQIVEQRLIDLAKAGKQATEEFKKLQAAQQNLKVQSITEGLADAKDGNQARKTAYGADFNQSAADIEATKQAMTELAAAGEQGGKAFQFLQGTLDSLNAGSALETFQDNAKELVENFPFAAISQIGQSIGQALASGEDPIKAGAAALLKAFGDFLVQFGEQLLVLGAAQVLVNPVLGLAEIAGGAALIIAGSEVGASGSASTASSGGGSGGGYTPSVGANFSSSFGSTNNQGINIHVTFDPLVGKIEGEDLRIVSETNAYRIKRRTGNI